MIPHYQPCTIGFWPANMFKAHQVTWAWIKTWYIIKKHCHFGGWISINTLWWTNILLWKMAIEIVDFPIKKWWIFPWQTVSSPEDIAQIPAIFTVPLGFFYGSSSRRITAPWAPRDQSWKRPGSARDLRARPGDSVEKNGGYPELWMVYFMETLMTVDDFMMI